MSGERVVLFDLDGTLTRRDTYLAYLIGYLLRHPARLVHAPALAVAVLLYVCRRRDNTWLKITFLRLILGGEELGALEAWTRVFLDRVLTRGMRARPGDHERAEAVRHEGCRPALPARQRRPGGTRSSPRRGGASKSRTPTRLNYGEGRVERESNRL